MIVCFIHRSVLHPVIIRTSSCSSRLDHMQRLRDRHYVEKESKLEVSIKSVSSELTESYQRGGRMNVRSRRDERYQENKPVNHLNMVHMSSHRMKHPPQYLQGAVLGPMHIYYKNKLSVLWDS